MSATTRAAAAAFWKTGKYDPSEYRRGWQSRSTCFEYTPNHQTRPITREDVRKLVEFYLHDADTNPLEISLVNSDVVDTTVNPRTGYPYTPLINMYLDRAIIFKEGEAVHPLISSRALSTCRPQPACTTSAPVPKTTIYIEGADEDGVHLFSIFEEMNRVSMSDAVPSEFKVKDPFVTLFGINFTPKCAKKTALNLWSAFPGSQYQYNTMSNVICASDRLVFACMAFLLDQKSTGVSHELPEWMWDDHAMHILMNLRVVVSDDPLPVVVSDDGVVSDVVLVNYLGGAAIRRIAAFPIDFCFLDMQAPLSEGGFGVNPILFPALTIQLCVVCGRACSPLAIAAEMVDLFPATSVTKIKEPHKVAIFEYVHDVVNDDRYPGCYSGICSNHLKLLLGMYTQRVELDLEKFKPKLETRIE